MDVDGDLAIRKVIICQPQIPVAEFLDRILKRDG